jgi:hypothetical protein
MRMVVDHLGYWFGEKEIEMDVVFMSQVRVDLMC